MPERTSGDGLASGHSASPNVKGLVRKGGPAALLFSANSIFKGLSVAAGLSTIFIIGWIGIQLFTTSAATRHEFGWRMLTTSTWDVPRSIYGALPFIYGSFVSSLLALVIAVPLAVGCVIFLTQFAPRWIAGPVSFFLDLLAAVPSIIYGLWGFLVLCPWMQAHLNPWLEKHFGSTPLFAGPAVMTNLLAAGVILALMILPFVTAVSREVLLALPPGYREASMGLGATKWETIRSALLPAATSGILGAAMLGLGRAVGETMAVVMVIGNTPKISTSLLQPGYSMPALLANQFNEAYNDPMQLSALLEIALILFAFTFILNAAARLLIRLTSRTGARAGGATRFSSLKKWGRLVFKGLAIGGLGYFVLRQTLTDFRREGLAGLLGPLEVAILLVLGLRGLTAILRGSKFWYAYRKLNDRSMRLVTGGAALVACTGLFLLFAYVVKNGAHGLTVNLFTELPRPPGIPGGGLKNAILGTLQLISIASVIGIPLGVLGGMFLSEYPESKLGFPIRFAADVLNGTPSVVIGLFAYAVFVLPFKHFSALAGGAALGIMMIPMVVRVTDEMMRLVPVGMREASMGLGATKMQTTLKIVLPGASKGVITGILLAVARVAGETAPLLFTAFGSQSVNKSLKEPVSSLTLKIYEYAGSPFEDWVQQAWAGALVLLMMILVINLAARFATRSKLA